MVYSQRMIIIKILAADMASILLSCFSHTFAPARSTREKVDAAEKNFLIFDAKCATWRTLI